MFEFILTNRYRCLDGHTSRKIQNVYSVLYKVNWSFGYTNCKKYWKCFPFFFLVGLADVQKTLPALNTDSCHLLIWIFCLHVVSYVCDPFVV